MFRQALWKWQIPPMVLMAAIRLHYGKLLALSHFQPTKMAISMYTGFPLSVEDVFPDSIWSPSFFLYLPSYDNAYEFGAID
jgi:hypothetical protein